jgi:glycosyltransferase involved in cell wall biosynthesis
MLAKRRGKLEIHQITPALLYGDGVSNHVVEMWKLFRSWGFKSEIFTQYCHPRYADICRDYRQYESSPDNVLIFHYAIGSDVTDFVRELPDRVLLYYHNVTPPRFFRGINPDMVSLLVRGRQQLGSFRSVPLAIAASEYNRQELLRAGFRNVIVVPYILDFSGLESSAKSEAGMAIQRKYDDGAINILFVGRIAPNKCQDDLIRVFDYYHKFVNSRSRLLLVGSPLGSEVYQSYLESMVGGLGLEGTVHFCGHVGLEEGLGAYYRIASVFISMSEHEGFCIPLLESAHFGVPIIAYKATGVPYTLGDSGILVGRKRFDMVAEAVELLTSDAPFREKVIASQSRLLRRFSSDNHIGLLRRAILEEGRGSVSGEEAAQ